MTDTLLTTVRSVLEQRPHRIVEVEPVEGQGLEGASVEGHHILAVDALGTHGDLSIQVHVLDHERQVVVYARRGPDTPSGVRPTMSEFVTRANRLLAVGSFDLDLDDGEVRFRVGVDVSDVELPPAIFAQMLRTVLGTMDAFAAGFDRVLSGDTDVPAILFDLADD